MRILSLMVFRNSFRGYHFRDNETISNLFDMTKTTKSVYIQNPLIAFLFILFCVLDQQIRKIKQEVDHLSDGHLDKNIWNIN